MDKMDYVIGIDFGTDSVRALVVDAQGYELVSEICNYPRWKECLYCDPSANMYRQHPLDHIEALEESVTAAQFIELPSPSTRGISDI